MTLEAKNDPLRDALRSDDPRVRLAAFIEIERDRQIRLSDPQLSALLECLGSDRKAVQRRAVDAIAALARRDPRIVPALQKSLTGEEPRRRWGAAYSLGLIGGALDLRAQKVLLEALSSRDGDVRWAAAELAVRLGNDNPGEIRRELIALETHNDHNARKMALYCLRDLRFADPEVRAMVERASRSSEADVRLAVLSLLAHLADGDESAEEIAMRYFSSDPHPGVRRAAAVALGRLGSRSRRVLDALERAARQREDPSLSRAAKQALKALEQSK